MSKADWDSFKAKWEIRDGFPFPPDVVISSLSKIHKYFGPGFENDQQREGLGRSLILLELVELGIAFATAEKIGSPPGLIKKLKCNRDSDALHVGLSEAAFIKRILPVSEKIQYEPSMPGTTRNPDVVQKIRDQLIQYEVHLSSESAQEKERDQIISELANKVADSFNKGALDIYLKKIKLTTNNIKSIIGCTKEIISKKKDIKIEIAHTALIYYAPSGSVRLPEDRDGEQLLEDGLGVIVDTKLDRSDSLKKEMGKRSRYPGVILYTFGKDESGRRARKLVRIWRQTFDDRVWRKMIEEARQLSDEFPGIVVIDIGGATALIDEWKIIALEEITSGVHESPSAIWLREKVHGLDVHFYKENFITNPIANQPLDPKIIKVLFPPDKYEYGK